MAISERESQDRPGRLSEELDQADARAAAPEDALKALAGALYRERAHRRRTEARLRHFLVRDLSEGGEPPLVSAALGAAIEQLRVLGDGLEAATKQLARGNQQLDRLVAERTAALGKANPTLEHVYAEPSRRVEQEIGARAAVQAQLFQSQKLEAIGQLTGGIAHDFNNLLTVITSGLQLLSRTADEAHRARLIKRMEEAAWRGADLTRRLLAFARRQPLNPRPLDVARHVNGLRELLRHGLRDDIRIDVSVPSGLWAAQADLGALELSLLNLAVNARDAMPNGGRMVLGARNVPQSSALPERLGLAAGDYVELFVADTGTGMSAELLSRVFEPFFTTKSGGKGTGLGLAQVYGFAKQSGGTALVQSREAEGTTVSVLLPRAVSSPDEPPVGAAQSGEATPPEHLSVLVVEDDDEVATMVADMLEQLGHRALRVSTLAAAIAVLSGGEAVHLILTDVLLGSGGSGLDLAREVSRRGLKLPIVLTSGYGGGMTGRLAAAKLPFLRKPYTLWSLRDMLRTAMQPAAPSFRGSEVTQSDFGPGRGITRSTVALE